jgi:hypothetical protein
LTASVDTSQASLAGQSRHRHGDAAGRILPVLDGFDEIAEDLRPAARRQLSDADMPLVLTSRPKEYTAAVAGTLTA